MKELRELNKFADLLIDLGCELKNLKVVPSIGNAYINIIDFIYKDEKYCLMRDSLCLYGVYRVNDDFTIQANNNFVVYTTYNKEHMIKFLINDFDNERLY